MTSTMEDSLASAHLHKKLKTSHLDWQETLNQSVLSIVSIRFSQVSSFDTEPAEASEATGFIVDKDLGLILTNRHVVCSGPFVGECVFHDHEEVDVFPVYRDPIHDFGFLKFDPKAIKYMPLNEIELRPDLAQVGLEVRVVGNDAGEKLSILQGSISRLNRNAPDYGELTFNDFNTFYLQAASSTSGGSSGSPVLNVHGQAVALQAGGHLRAATDFFFPLDRVKRVLDCLRKKKPVTRGTIQVQFYYRPFDEVRRMGLQPSTEELVRNAFPTEVGMLVAETVVPEGPGSEFLEVGDVLLKVNGVYITHFVSLEDILDQNVGSVLTFQIERGGVGHEFKIKVQDMHSITPDRYLMAGGAKLNNLSYQLARQFAIPVSGVYLAEPGGCFALDRCNPGNIITSLNAIPTPNLDAFIKSFNTLANGQRVPITYYSIADVHTKQCEIIDIDRHWSPFKLVIRNDETGLWDFQDLDSEIPRLMLSPSTAHFKKPSFNLGNIQEAFYSLVHVNMYLPFKIEGFPNSRKQGVGLILDAVKGLVVCSRMIAPSTLCNINITVAASITIPARVIFLHPTKNVSILSYDPVLLGKTPLKSAVLSNEKLVSGSKVNFICFGQNQSHVSIESTVTDIIMSHIPPNVTPRYRAINFEAILIDCGIAQAGSTGALVDKNGHFQGIWLSFLGETSGTSGKDKIYYYGMDMNFLVPIVEKIQSGEIPILKGLPIEVSPVTISKARQMGVKESWLTKVGSTNSSHVLMIKNIECHTPTANVLEDLDILLSMNGRIITKMADIEGVVGTPAMVLVRGMEEYHVNVPVTILDGECVKHIVLWAGATLHEPHRAVRQQSKRLPSNVYVTARVKGSPSYQYGLTPTMFITHVNGQETPDLETFLKVVLPLPEFGYVRIKTMSFDGIPALLSLKTNRYFKTASLKQSLDGNQLIWQ